MLRFFFTDTINACPLCPLCPLTAFFEFVRLLYFTDFHWGYKKSATFAFFLVVSLQKKNEKKFEKSYESIRKAHFRCRIFAPAFKESWPQTVRITAASLLHHRCIAANTLSYYTPLINVKLWQEYNLHGSLQQ